MICGLLVAVTFGVQSPVSGQDRPKPDEFQQFDRFKQGSDPVGNTPDEFFDKFAKYYVGRLNDSAIQKDGMSQMIQELAVARCRLQPLIRDLIRSKRSSSIDSARR